MLGASGEEAFGGTARAEGAVHLQRDKWVRSLRARALRPRPFRTYHCRISLPRSPSCSYMAPCLRDSPKLFHKQKLATSGPGKAPEPRTAHQLTSVQLSRSSFLEWRGGREGQQTWLEMTQPPPLAYLRVCLLAPTSQDLTLVLPQV